MTDFALATVKALTANNDGPGEFEAVLSTSDLDRDGEVIDAKAFDPLPASIPIFYHHDWQSGAKPVGKGVPFYDGDIVKVKGTFASTAAAQEVRALVTEGIVSSMSVGFLNGKRTVKAGVPHVTSGEVFEGSLTPIPINTAAAMIAAKALDARSPVAKALTGLMSPDEIRKIEGLSRKAVDGSWEQRSDELYEALQTAYADADWVERIATFDDHVIVEVHGGASNDKSFDIAYTFDGSDVVLGDATEVETVESLTVTPKSLLSDSTGAADPAAKAAGSAVTDEGEQAKATFRLLSQLGTA